MQFEHIDQRDTRLTGTYAEFDLLREGVEVLNTAVVEDEIMGRHRDTHLTPGYIRDLDDKLPKAPAMAAPDEQGRTVVDTDELLTLCNGLRLASAYTKRDGAVMGYKGGQATTALLSREGYYNQLRRELLPGVREEQ